MATYSSDILTGGTPSANSVYGGGYEASKACDDNTGTLWSTAVIGFPMWWKYDLGVEILKAKAVEKLRLISGDDGSNFYVKNFVLSGSNNDSAWIDIYSGLASNAPGWKDFTFTNAIQYRYYRVTFSDTYSGTSAIAVLEFEMMYDVDRVFDIGGGQAISISPLNMFMQQWKWEGCLWRPSELNTI
jgi:hypothetical protein